MSVVIPIERPKPVFNRCAIEVFWWYRCVDSWPFYFLKVYGLCHRTGSYLFLCPFVLSHKNNIFWRNTLVTKQILWRWHHQCARVSSFLIFVGKVFQSIVAVGIPMYLNCAPLHADIFLCSYEAEFIQCLLSAGEKQHLGSISRTSMMYRL